MRSRPPGRASVVTIAYKSLPIYRISFFEALRSYLRDHGIQLQLVYGQAPPEEQARGDTGQIEWAHSVHNYFLRIGSRYLCWQPCLRMLARSDLVIVEQQSKMINNYLLLALQRFGGPRVALWGHGINFARHSASPFGESLKRWMSRYAHWWFAYNDLGASVISKLGFPEQRMTIVQNALDTERLLKKKSETSEVELRTLRDSLGLGGANTAVYLGGLYAEKRIEFLLQAARQTRRLLQDFQLLIIGSGPLRQRAQEAASEASWIHYVGPKFNEDKVPYLMLCKVMLMPGAVGLASVDSFALQVPLVAVDLPNNGPEIEYIVNGDNGLILDGNTTADEFGAAVAGLLVDDAKLQRLKKGCFKAAGKYTLENMVERFGQGVLKALSV